MKRLLLPVVIALAALLLVGEAPALAMRATTLRATLAATPDGAAIRGRGRAVYTSEGDVQTIRVSLRARVPDGTGLDVWIPATSPRGEPVLIGSVTFTRQRGELYVVAPRAVTSGETVAVYDQNDTVVMTGTFR